MSGDAAVTAGQEATLAHRSIDGTANCTCGWVHRDNPGVPFRAHVTTAIVEDARPIIEAEVRERMGAVPYNLRAYGYGGELPPRAAVRTEPEQNTFYGSDEEFLTSLDDPAPGTAKIRLCDAVLFTKTDDPLVCRLSHGHPGDHADPDQQRTWP